MKKFLTKTDLPMRMLALVLALLLWGAAMTSRDPLRNRSFRTTPGSIELEGEDVLLQQHNLSVIDGQDATVAFSVEGKASDITALQKQIGNVRIVVDVSDVETAGAHDVRYVIRLPDSAKVSLMESHRTGTVRLTIDEITGKDVPVTLPDDFGTPASGYLYGTPEISAESVRIDGPATILETISAAQLELRADNLSHQQSIQCAYTLLDSNGNKIESPHLTFGTDTVTVTIPVYKLASVPLTVALRPSADITEDMVKVQIEPETVQIYGRESVVDRVEEISLGEIDLSRVQTGARLNMAIKLPGGVRLLEGISSTAAVTLQIDGVSSKTVKISDVTLVDTSTAEPRLNAELVADAIDLTLSGKNSALTALNLADITITVTFDSSIYGAGTHWIPVEVQLPADSGITVIGRETLQTAVILTLPEVETPVEPGDNTDTPPQEPADNPANSPVEGEQE